MVEMLVMNLANTIGWRIDGRVSEAEVDEVFSAINHLAADGDVYIYQEIINIGAIEFDAVLEKLKFLFSGGLSDIKRVAIVTDKQWLQKVVGWEDKLFKSIDIRGFSLQERDQAINFLSE